MIKINPIFFDGVAALEEEEYSFKNKESKLTKLLIQIANQAENLPNLKQPNFKGDNVFKEGCISKIPEKLEIELVFIDNEDLMDFWNAPDNVLGFHSYSSGAYESTDQDFLATKHRIILYVNEEHLKNHIKEERKNELDPTSNRHDSEYLFNYLVTVTHEIAHCVELIEHANGLTPSEIQNMIDNGEIFYDLMDLSTGNGILFDFNESYSYSDLEEIMEERVEAKGVDWLNKINIDKKLFQEVLEEFSPKEEKKQVKIKKPKL
jgi:hypothetical protein